MWSKGKLAFLTQTTHGGYRYTRWRWRLLCHLLDAIGSALFRAARRFAKRSEPSEIFSEPRRILIVQLDHLGDAVLSLPLLGALRQRYPASSLHVLCGAWNQPFFEALPEVDRVEVLRFNRFARDWRRRGFFWFPALLYTACKLRGRYDLAFDVRGELPLALFLWLTGAPRRVGWACGGGGFLLTHVADWRPTRWEIDSRSALAELAGVSRRVIRRHRAARLRPPQPARQTVQRLLNSLPTPPNRLIVLHVGAGTPAKLWPLAHWSRLAASLARQSDAHVVLVGTSRDTHRAQQIAVGIPQGVSPRVHDWTGRLSIMELAALLQRADLFIGADSGPAHLAGAVGAATIVLFSGASHARQWRPRGQRVLVLRRQPPCAPCHRTRCPLADHPCMSGISVRRVLKAAQRWLVEKTSAAAPPAADEHPLLESAA